eukprot:gene16167-22328_t
MMRNVTDFFKKWSSNGPKHGGGDACMHPASQEETAYNPQGMEGSTPEYTMTHQSAPFTSPPTVTQSAEENYYRYSVSGLGLQPSGQSLTDQEIAIQVMVQQKATQQHMAQDQKSQQQMTLQQLAQHQSVQQQVPQPFSNSVAQPFLADKPTGECVPLMMPRPSPPTDKCFSLMMTPPSPTTSEPLLNQGEMYRHLRRAMSTPMVRNGMSQPLFKMLGEQSLKISLSHDQHVFVPNVNVTTAGLNASTVAHAISSLHTNSRLRSAFKAEPMSHLSMPVPHPSLMALFAEELAMGDFIDLDFELDFIDLDLELALEEVKQA